MVYFVQQNNEKTAQDIHSLHYSMSLCVLFGSRYKVMRECMWPQQHSQRPEYYEISKCK